MRRLARPTDAGGVPYVAKDVFKLCISRVKNASLKTRLLSIESVVESESAAFDLAAQQERLHTIARSTLIGGVVPKVEMMKVYTARMAKGSQPGRPIYDRIRNACVLNRCPLCDVGFVTTLDHHLPKSEYPVLAVTPTNLVPSCTWCQDAKDDFYPATQDGQTFHPYFDDFETDVWLKAVVVEGRPAAFEYEVGAPDHWSEMKAARARAHLRTFRLGELYTSNAGQEVVVLRHQLEKLYSAGGKVAVEAYLAGEVSTHRAARLNSWQSAMYAAALDSDWYCNGGFDLQ